MAAQSLYALIESDDNHADQKLIVAPTVGWFRSRLIEGAGVVPGLELGTMTILGHIYPLLAPQGATGVITHSSLKPGLHPVSYGQPLFQLGAPSAPLLQLQDRPEQEQATLEHGQIAIRSPSEGVFYRRPDPDSPPYVAVGDIVQQGRPLGLVEVMKCFNQIRFEGHGFPDRARVAAIPVDDGAEIRSDQVLFILEPL